MNRTSDDENAGNEPPMNGPDLLVGGLALAGVATAAYWLFSGSQKTEKLEAWGEPQAESQVAIAQISNESDLKCHVQRNIREILQTSGKPTLIADEWGYPHIGMGDLVYHFDGIDYVIELKWIDHHGLNDSTRKRSTVQTSNNQKKNYVKEQALRYGRLWVDQQRRPYDVQAMAIVNTLNGHFEIILSKRLIPNI